MEQKYGRGVRRECDVRGCRELARVLIEWPKKEIAGGVFVASKSEVCMAHKSLLLHHEAPTPISITLLETK